MPNVLLTQKCVRRCPYCFATKYLHNAPPNDIMRWEDLIYIADFFQSGGVEHLSLLGGEPLLHPDVGAIIKYLYCRGIGITLFTSGICTDQRREQLKEALQGVPPEEVTIVVNYNDPTLTPEVEKDCIDDFFETFAEYTSIGINVYKHDFNYHYPLQAIKKFNLQRKLRIGLAHPLPDNNNNCLPPTRKAMQRMAKELIAALPYFNAENVQIQMDCGFPLCAFSDEDLGRLYRHNRNGMLFACGSPIDITPDLQVWNCFPMSSCEQQSLLDFDSPQALRRHFSKNRTDLRKKYGGIYADCETCTDMLRDNCQSGCISHAINRTYALTKNV